MSAGLAVDALLIDGTNLCYRAWHAQARDDQEPDALTVASTAVKMAVTWWNKLELGRKRAIVCFDGAGATWRRRALDSQYKAQRTKRPEGLTVALQQMRRTILDTGGRATTIDGHEADDVIATYASLLDGRRLRAAILTSDQDLLQMVGARVRVLLIGRSVYEVTDYDEPAFLRKFGFVPALMADYKAIRGDDSDNIGGVPGIGEVKGKKIIAEHGTVEELYAWIGQGRWVDTRHITGLLKRHEALVRRNLAITTLDREVPGVALRDRAEAA